jgi:biotin transport system substrate-specific component
MTSAVISQRALPRSGVVAVLLVVAAAALTAVAAQWRVLLPFTPVPITGQTFAVLLTGAALGWKLGATGQLLYVAVGALGAPVFSDASGGFDVIVGATGGYLLGFVFAAGVVGWMAELRQDRTFATMFTAFILGSVVIYIFGAIGLMISAEMSVVGAVEAGVVPFLLGDLLKAAAAGILLPGAWKLLGD